MPDKAKVDYHRAEIQDVLNAGPHPDETWFHLQVSGAVKSKHLNISPDQLVAIRDILAPADNAGGSDVDLVHDAIARMYEDWERTGGPSPSVSDEARVAAEALGADPIVDEEALERIWDLRARGVDPRLVATAYVEAIAL